MTTAAMPEHRTDDDDLRELTVDELAARVGVTVRNLRAYSARGLLPPPRMVGRTGYYGREHVARLLLVREMLAEGYSLAMIERTLASAPPMASSATLALHRALLAPWLPPEPEFTTGAELAARAGVPEDSGRGRPAGRPRPASSGATTARLRVLDPALLTAGLQVVALGVPPDQLIAAQARVNEHVAGDRADLRADVRRQRLAGVRRGRGAARRSSSGCRPPSRACSRSPLRRCWLRSARRWPPPSRVRRGIGAQSAPAEESGSPPARTPPAEPPPRPPGR